MTRRSARRSPGVFLGASAPRESDFFQWPPTDSCGFNGESDRSEGSHHHESEDGSKGGRRGRDAEEPPNSSQLSASDIAQRALRELDALFEDMNDNQRARSDSQSGSDVESSDGGREEIGISLEEMSIALNAAIERHRPALSNEKSRRQSHRRRRGGVKADVDNGDSAASIPQEVALPIVHFQDVLQQRIKTFQATKQAEWSLDPATDARCQPWERQWRRTSSSHPPPTPLSALSLDGSRLSGSVRSIASASESESAESSASSGNPFAVAKRVEMLDQQQQTSRVWMNNQATETSSLFEAFSPEPRQQAQSGSTVKEVLYQPSSVSVSACSVRELPGEQSIETNRKGPAPEDLERNHPSRPNSVVARWRANELSSSTSSRSPSLSRSSLSSASSVSIISKRQSHRSSRTRSCNPKPVPESQAQLSYPASQRSEEHHPMETQSSRPTARSSEVFVHAFDRMDGCTEKQMCSPSWELDLSNFNP